MKNKILNEIKSIFLNGFLTLLPITVTFLLFRAAFRVIAHWIAPLHKFQPEFLQKIPYSEFLLVILFIFLLGIILKFFILKRIIHSVEDAVFYRVPILKTVYSGIKQIIHAVTQQDQLSFKKVIAVEFPRQGVYSIGFLTSEFPKNILPNSQIEYYNVFIPTTHLIAGNYIIVPREQIIETDITKQEAMSLIISGGIVKPERLFKQRS